MSVIDFFLRMSYTEYVHVLKIVSYLKYYSENIFSDMCDKIKWYINNRERNF